MSRKIFEAKLPRGIFETFDDRPLDQEIFHVHQTHSPDIWPFNNNQSELTEADGIFISYDDLKDKKLAIKTADCMPIVLLGETHIVFLHSGWAGLSKGILKAKEVKGINPFYAYIGPSIQYSSFQVQEDFKQHFPHSKEFGKIGEDLHFNLQKEAEHLLQSEYKDIKVEMSDICTMKSMEFNSYRRDKTTKRNWNIYSI